MLAIIQARMNSKRLPGKSLMKLNGIPILERVITRVRMSKNISKLIIATSKNKSDDLQTGTK